jgi:hypothetical protein
MATGGQGDIGSLCLESKPSSTEVGNMDRESIKVLRKFRDHFKWTLSSPTSPIKSLSQLVTLSSMKWIKDYEKATPYEKRKMIDEMKILQKEAERKEFLHNSREITENDE